MQGPGWILGAVAGLAITVGGGLLALGGAANPALAAPADAVVASAADPVPELLKSPADVARGRSLFAGTCGAYCHKMTPAHTDAAFLFGCTFQFGGSDAEIFHTITHGVPGSRMVAFGGAIPDADIWRVIAYLRSASQCPK